jgi:hypothetical protein
MAAESRFNAGQRLIDNLRDERRRLSEAANADHIHRLMQILNTGDDLDLNLPSAFPAPVDAQGDPV